MKPLIGVLLGTMLLAGPALAQPADRPLRIVAGFAPGGTSDIVARVVADGVAAALGQRPVVENRTGANGFIAAEAVVRGPTDGSTVLQCPMGSMTISPEVPGMHIPIDVGRDLVPVANVARSSYAVVTGARGPHRSLEALMAAARSRPGGLSYGSAGIGTAQHLSAERLKRMAGLDIVHVPYRGAAPAALDLIAGRIDLLITNLGDVIRQVQGGELRLLALADEAGWPDFPDAPRLPRIVPGLEVIGWFGICGPRGMPEEAVARWAGAIRASLQDPVVQKRLLDNGLAPGFEDPAAFGATITRDRQAWGEAIRAANVRAE
ncbi:tripartite tricarboxylate transporter substrate binding protein [Paeniroseomonas aquatica]|uniref:Tripartite tricarboxylate transporter substrate binding protein n=1 Tax=Paeniroseomonas aquatica TaxID=373043 RepID=A0ABT8A137_9PROT|nr:tripartite tricarboxylate transporter substrate binding protein [Paeniroseomonas aquatica]MDN3563411.1 tripartite tricarboxylate transporter substrate binding protein [Paeniroseomonas aquatica]